MFPGSGVYKGLIMVSAGGTHWQRNDVSFHAERGHAFEHTFNQPVRGRFVRVVLRHVPPGADFGIAEVTVFGHHGRQIHAG